MMKGKLYLLVLCTILCCAKYATLNATTINFTTGTQETVAAHDRGAQSVYFHNNTDDMHFYGTNRWAVYFDFCHWFHPTNTRKCCIEDHEHTSACIVPIHPITFNLSQISIHASQSIPNALIYLHKPATTQPGTLISQTSSNLSTGWNHITLENPEMINTVWVIVEFPTSAEGAYMSASSGDGETSYYFERFSAGSGIFRKMKENGFQAEFMISLVGEFTEPVSMVNILSYETPRNINAREGFLPKFTIQNNSTTPVNSVNAIFTTSIPGFTQQVIPIGDLNINEEIKSDGIPNISNYMITIPEDGYGLYSTGLIIQYTTTEPAAEPTPQSASSTINVFPHTKEKHLLEIFADSENRIFRDNLSYFQEDVAADTLIDVIYHFPSSVDMLYTPGAHHRNRHYMHTGNQHTYFNGDLHINGFHDRLFRETLEIHQAQALTDKTFITLLSSEAHIDSLNNLSVSLAYENQNTLLLSNPSPALRIYVGLVQPDDAYVPGIGSYIFNIITQFISDNEGIPASLSFGSTFTTGNLTIPIHNIIKRDRNRENKISVIAIIQDATSKTIFHHDIIDISHLNILERDTETPDKTTNVQVFPNPIPQNSRINFYINTDNPTQIKAELYNIKGQKIDRWENDAISKERNATSIKLNQTYPNGIYFLRLQWNEGNIQKSQVRKVVILK